MSEERDDEEQRERPRPRVVDKRVSARGTGAGTDSERRDRDAAPPAAPRRRAEEAPLSEPPPPAGTGAQESKETRASPSQQADAGSAASTVWTPEQEAQAQQLAQQIAQTPSVEWVVNTAVNLINVAGTKLELDQVQDAQLAIDALSGLIQATGARLGSAEQPLRQALAELQLTYTQRQTPPPGRGPRPAPG